MDPVKDELLLTDDYEETDDDESDQTDDVSIKDTGKWVGVLSYFGLEGYL